jgi:uncharacterized protein YdeI (YjbR/CyaY-like superfamily)
MGVAMAKKDPRVDAYIAKAQPFAKPILNRFRKAVHAGCPDVTETMKWSFPHFDYKGMLCSMAAFKAHCAFGFWKGSLLESAPKKKKDKSRDAMGQFGRITSLDEMPGGPSLVTMVKEAAALNDAGVKVVRAPKAPTQPVKAPAYMLAAIRKNKKARAAYEAFSPSHQREYVEWITEAKTDATRDRRLETAVQWMAGGKRRNWKYER